MSLFSLSQDPDDDAIFFTTRPKRTETCICCGGSGSIDNAYALKHSINKNLDKARDEGMVTACPVGSSSIFECCREAAEIARRARRPVAFWFIDRVVVVSAGDDPDSVARLWWQDTYGETPEQTAAHR